MLHLNKVISLITNHNWLAILYFNFKMLPFRQAIHLPFDFYHQVRFESLKGRVKLNFDNIYRGVIKVGSAGSEMFPHLCTTLIIDGDFVFSGPCVIGINSCCRCNQNGRIYFGPNTIIGAGNLVFCQQKIDFGENFLSSWNCQFMDTDTHTVTNFEDERINHDSPIIIGKNVWIGNYVSVYKGSRIPSNTIIASHSLCNKDYSESGEGCILAGTPARVVKKEIKWKI